VTLTNINTEVIECDDTVTVEHWIGEFRVSEIDPVTGGLHLVGRFLSGWVPPTHAHRIVAGGDVGHGARCASGVGG
jgi:hypothetical protein